MQNNISVAMKKLIIIILFSCIFCKLQATIRYVKPVAAGAATGLSWANASASLQSMINISVAGDQIWVAAGTYKPNSYPTGCTSCSGGTARDYTFSLKSNVSVFGGFVGNETMLAQRNPVLNLTILSGDIGTSSSSDNVHHVVLAVDVTQGSLQGFTVKDGNANGSGASGTLDVTIITGSPRLIDKRYGGGIGNYYSNESIYNCVLIGNIAMADGGGMDNYSSSPQIGATAFISNVALNGGAMSNYQSSPPIENCLFISNTATLGGGIYNLGSSAPSIRGCTIFGNNASSNGGGIYNAAGTNPTTNNSIIWGNTGAGTQGVYNTSTPVISKSIVQGGYATCTSCPNTNGNIDPLFVNAADPNGADNIWATVDDGLRLSNCSVGIDIATPLGFYLSNDIAGQDRTFDNPFRANNGSNYLDLGAYENQNTVPTKIYVNALNMGFQTGESWAAAFTDLGDAIIAACSGNEIWVAAGTYKPSGYPVGCTGCTTNRDYTFLLKDDVKIYGGFAGTETAISQRNLNLNKTILSGDINSIGVATDNAYHILLSVSDGTGTKLDGLTIKDGGDATYYASPASITVQGHIFEINRGGGLNNYQSNLEVVNCDFISNRSNTLGGGIYNDFSNATIQNCSFVTNAGSGMVNSNSNPAIQSCSFIANTASNGGGIYNIISSPVINNCAFIANNAQSGGGINNTNACSPVITNCTFVSNFADSNGGGIMNIFNCNPVIKNTVFWGNTGNGTRGIANSDGSSVPVVSYSVVQGGYSPCTSCPNTNGNIDPQLINIADPDGPDNIHRTFDDGIALRRTSPAINTGTNTGSSSTDILGNPTFINKEIGAYELMPKDYCFAVNGKYLADVPIESGTHLSNQKIVSVGTIGNATSVIFDSPVIILLPGFKTQSNAVFSTQNVGCIGMGAAFFAK